MKKVSLILALSHLTLCECITVYETPGEEFIAKSLLLRGSWLEEQANRGRELAICPCPPSPLLSTSTTDEKQIWVTFERPAYWMVQFEHGGCKYNAWCVDVGRGLSNGNYLADLISTCVDPPDGAVDETEHLDLVNYVINHYGIGTPVTVDNCDGSIRTVSWKEIQKAVWELTDHTPDHSSISGYDSCVSDYIVAQAHLHGEGFQPGPTDKLAVMIVIDNGDQITHQVIVVEVDSSCVQNHCCEPLDGDVTLMNDPPADASHGQLEDSNFAHYWHEQQCVNIGSPTYVSILMSDPNLPKDGDDFFFDSGVASVQNKWSGNLESGTYSSHFIHADKQGKNVEFNFKVTFACEIVAVVYRNRPSEKELLETDEIFGNPSTNYADGGSSRGFELDGAKNWMRISADKKTLHANMVVAHNMDDIRIITETCDCYDCDS